MIYNSMLSKHTVSVIMLAYNHEKYIQDAIKSIIAQTYKNIELIIIDDGSKDSTYKKILEMESDCKNRFVRTIFKTQNNVGTSTTLNRLVALTEGQYIYIIASDDIAAPDAIETEVLFLDRNPDYGLVVGDNAIIDSESNRIYYGSNGEFVYTEKDVKYKTFGEFLQAQVPYVNFCSKEFGSYESFCRTNYVPNGYLIRKIIFNGKDLFSINAPLEDWWLMLQISKYWKMKYINKILFYYRQHSSNTINQREKIDSYVLKTFEYEKKCVLSKSIDKLQ
ncbi:MAG: glycosyltransferase family 2 protein [Endomicrobium sp.]|nr:glycosyltransferase family 2 protein [Endomicrobium sp.]